MTEGRQAFVEQMQALERKGIPLSGDLPVVGIFRVLDSNNISILDAELRETIECEKRVLILIGLENAVSMRAPERVGEELKQFENGEPGLLKKVIVHTSRDCYIFFDSRDGIGTPFGCEGDELVETTVEQLKVRKASKVHRNVFRRAVLAFISGSTGRH